ncbi:helix-turn-helix domain-containing protein [Micromonospora endophytica]|uniref:Transcriptional regulator n=1 Tax=Micromonospora endophytica TaxID=515350 RepID=A0A2W2D506_9ACTN|nr:XRE family transcriptional regulator [Micromonospora endophytica]PZF87513.1 transcriptional regulator [Micromonospora endophytica]RIW40608.1 XRE family transcriptional regulator [Micromonospora endophytica]BCJ59136.1 XRE family transcriptional regulator [Micromonospora endophytica]
MPPPSEPDPTAVGRRVRALREARGISLSALARLAQVGKATLSGLENGTRNPTLETLYAITAQLGVPLTAVLFEPGAEPTVRGAAVNAILLEVFNDSDATYELYRMRIAPGTDQLSPAHQAGVTEHVTVFAGVLRAGPADAPLTAAAGDHLRWASDVPHVYAAVGDEEVAATLLLRYPRKP